MMKKRFVCLLLSTFLLLSCIPSVFANDSAGIPVSTDTETIFEAETEKAVIQYPYVVKEDVSDASGGKYVNLEFDGAPYTPNVSKDKAGDLIYPLDVQEDGYYYIWQKVYATDVDSRTSWFGFDDGSWSYIAYEAGSQWKWYMMGSAYFDKGRHTLKVTYRQPRLKFDQFLITTKPDYVPDGDRLSKPGFLPGEGEEQQLYYNLPPVTPPANVHPRLFVQDKDIKRIRKNLDDSDNRNAYEHMKKLSELDSDGVLPILTPEQNTNVNDNVLACAEANAFLYLLDGDQEKGIKAKNMAINLISTMVNRAVGADLNRNAGYCILIASEIYDWCYDLFSDEERTLFREYLYMHISTMSVGWPAVKEGNVAGHGMENLLWTDLMSAAVAIYDEDPKMYNLVAGRMFEEMIPSKNFQYGSTFFNEGSFYGAYRYYFEILNAYIFRGLGYENIFSKNQQYALYGMLYGKRPDGKNFVRGDDSAEDLNGFDGYYGTMCFYAGNFYKDPYLKREFYRCNPMGIQYTTASLGIRTPMFLIANDTKVSTDASFHDFPLTTFSGAPMGIMTARTSWDDGLSSNGLIAQFNAGGQYLGGHQHYDFGHFSLYYKGGLAIDSGMYESAPFSENGQAVTSLTHGSVHHVNYATRSIAHNTMLIYDPNEPIYTAVSGYSKARDGGQHILTGPPQTYQEIFDPQLQYGNVLAYDFGPDKNQPAYSYLKGDLTQGYSDKVENFNRSFLFFNFFDETYPGALIVFDNVKSSNKDFKKTWLLHSQEEPEIDGNRTTVARTEFGADGRLINDTLLPKQASVEKIGGEGKEFWIDGKNYTAVPKTPTTESGKWRTEVSSKENQKQDYFLNVLQVSDNNETIEPLKTELIMDDDSFVGVKIKDRVALLKKDDTLTSKTIDISLPESEEALTFVVTGLKSGKWNIIKDGKTITSQYALKGHDTVSFTGTSGTYQLKWIYEPSLPKLDFSVQGNIRKSETLPIDIKIDTMYETFSSEPLVQNGVLCLPLEEFLKKAEIPYTKDGETYLISGKVKVSLKEGSKEAEAGEEAFQLEEKVFLHNDTVYAPIPKLLEKMKYEMQWDEKRRIAFLKLGTKSLDRMQIVNSDDPARIKIYDVDWSSGSNEVGYVTVDNNTLSYWAALGDKEWVSYTFEESSSISKAELKWHLGNQRVQKFDIEVSNDGENWQKVYTGQSDGVTDDFETVSLNIKDAYRYLRIVGHGNSQNSWNSLAELRLYR